MCQMPMDLAMAKEKAITIKPSTFTEVEKTREAFPFTVAPCQETETGELSDCRLQNTISLEECANKNAHER